MISEGAIKTKYVRDVLERDAARINKVQAGVIKENFKVVTGKLWRSIYRRDFDVVIADDNMAFLQFNNLRYLRFLDIKNRRDRTTKMGVRRKLALYNRVIWGVLYHPTLRDLRFGLTKEIKEQIRAELEKAI